MAAQSLEAFLEQVPVDGRTVLREAIGKARRERKLEVRVFGHRKASLYEIAREGMQWALDRETCRRNNIAAGLWRASLDPVALEIRQHELALTLLNDKRLGKRGFERRYIDDQIAHHARRLADLREPFAQAAE